MVPTLSAPGLAFAASLLFYVSWRVAPTGSATLSGRLPTSARSSSTWPATTTAAGWSRCGTDHRHVEGELDVPLLADRGEGIALQVPGEVLRGIEGDRYLIYYTFEPDADTSAGDQADQQ